jgi:lactoylglutathione lyase
MKMLHTMIRVGNLERSVLFYTEALGMTLRRKKDYPGGKFTLAFLGFGKEGGHEIELTHNWETDSYDTSNGFGHIALGVKDIYKTVEEMRTKGGKVVREPGPMKHGSTVIAFVEDPDGYKIELIER